MITSTTCHLLLPSCSGLDSWFWLVSSVFFVLLRLAGLTPAPSDKCASHANCTECTLSSKVCHWCAFDESCHAIGSWYGCSHGVDCFNNDRCMRDVPENIIDEDGAFGSVWSDVGVIPVVLICVIGLLTLCCNSLCFVTVRAIKGAYDDWSLVNYRIVDGENESTRTGNNGGDGSIIGITSIGGGDGADVVGNLSDIMEGDEEEEINLLGADGKGDEEPSHGRKNIMMDKQSINIDTTTNNNDIETNSKTNEIQTLKSDKTEGNGHHSSEDIDTNNYQTQALQPLLPSQESLNEEYIEDIPTNDNTNQLGAHPSLNRLPPSSSIHSIRSTLSLPQQPPSSSHIRCCYNTCLTWYVLSVITAMIFTTGAIYYFPKVPEYNICSDEFAWNSIIDSLTSLKVEASFQILASIKNKNHLDIVLDNVGGSFRHNEEDVGTFSMPTSTIASNSITDILVTCSVRPDRWEALGLVSDYYRSKLELVINVNGNIKIKGIGYSIPVTMKDVLVKVNDPQMDDRHLCQCPEWKDLSPTSSPALSLSFEDAIEQPALILGRHIGDDTIDSKT